MRSWTTNKEEQSGSMRLLESRETDSYSYSSSAPEGKDDKKLADRLPLISSSMKDDIMNSKEGTSNNFEHGLKVMSVLSASGMSLIWLVPMSALAIVMIVIGAVYMHKCQGERFIPIWLVVYGSFTLVHLVIAIVRTVIATRQNSHDRRIRHAASHIGTCADLFVSLFLFAWLIAGSVWVFKFYSFSHSPTCTGGGPLVPGCQCDSVVLTFAFAVIIVIYIYGLISCLVSCCCYCCICCIVVAALADKEKKSDDTEPAGTEESAP